jgi:hypothetical protein
MNFPVFRLFIVSSMMGVGDADVVGYLAWQDWSWRVYFDKVIISMTFMGPWAWSGGVCDVAAVGWKMLWGSQHAQIML